jgi:hypothetical protein
LLNTDYLDFHHLVGEAIIIENKRKEVDKDGKDKMVARASITEATLGPAFSSLVKLLEPHF